MVRVGVCLSGCGFLDGAEIHESVLTLLAIDQAGAEALCFAPDVPQMHVVNHLTGNVVPGESRNVLQEAARIARGQIRPASRVSAHDFDALILPGGYGAAKNLCDFALVGSGAKVEPEVARIVRETVQARKPLGAICISPVVVAAVLRGSGLGLELTVGDDAATAAALADMGVRHVPCLVSDVHVDQANSVVSTPAYMLAQNIAEAADGIQKLVNAVLERAAVGARA